jgi:hypothetical protein
VLDELAHRRLERGSPPLEARPRSEAAELPLQPAKRRDEGAEGLDDPEDLGVQLRDARLVALAEDRPPR